MFYGSSSTITCKFCSKENLAWSWNFHDKRAILVDREKSSYGPIPHMCRQKNKSDDEDDISPAKCKYCKKKDLFWVARSEQNGNTKYELIESYGLMHVCDEGREFYSAWSEAKKEDYARTKKRVLALKDRSCGYCEGRGFFWRNDKKDFGLGVGIVAFKRRGKTCSRCMGMGRVDLINKKYYLAKIRKKLWPWRPHK